MNVSLYHTVITCSNAGCSVTKDPAEEFYCGEQTLGGAKGRQDQSLACQVCPRSMMGLSGIIVKGITTLVICEGNSVTRHLFMMKYQQHQETGAKE